MKKLAKVIEMISITFRILTTDGALGSMVIIPVKTNTIPHQIPAPI